MLIKISKHRDLLLGGTAVLLVLGGLIFVASKHTLTPATQMPQTVPDLTLVDGQAYSAIGVFHDAPIVHGLKSYTSEELGTSLKYPEGYLLFENKTDQDQTGVYKNFRSITIGPKEPILQTIERARAGFAGEGPHTISLSFFYEPQLKVANIVPLDYLKQWLEAHQGQSNFYPDGQGDGTVHATLTPTTIDGVPAVRYHNYYGMYESDMVAFVHGDSIVIVSSPSDPGISKDFDTVLSNIILK